jgi:GGDEF domain-containing protein
MEAGADAFYDKASGLETLFNDLAELLPGDRSEAQDKPSTLLRDGLTGLYKEASLCERLDQAARFASRDGADLAVYVMRLAGLTELPAEVANALALQIARRLREFSAEADIVARSGADQFAFVLTRVDQPDQSAAHAQRLAALMAEPFQAAGRDYRLVVEMGMALFPADAIAPRSLLTLAEASAFGAL